MSVSSSHTFTHDSGVLANSGGQTLGADEEKIIGGNDNNASGHGLEKGPGDTELKDPNLVNWNGPNDPANPKNWSFGRKWAGIGGSAPLSVGGGVLGDLFESKDRGRAVAVYSLMPLLGPALGPIAGGFITENTTWRWIFYAVSCLDGLVLILKVFLLQETYAPVLLHRKRNQLAKQTKNHALHTKYEDDHKLAAKLGTGFIRPFILLFTQPIVQALGVYMATTYGLAYLVLSTVSSVFTSAYHESIGISGPNYISIAVGCYVGAQTAGFATDRIYRKLTARDPEGKGRPEFRIPFILVGAALVPAGILWYGWPAEERNHWIVPNLGLSLFSAGRIVVMTSIQAYILDTYAWYGASALAAVEFMRALAGFGFSLFAPAMYKALGYGWGNLVLALAAILAGFGGPLAPWRYGAWLRSKSPFATDGL